MLGLASNVSAAAEKYCFEIYGIPQGSSDAALYSVSFTNDSDGTITEKSGDVPSWVPETANFNGFPFANNMIYQVMAGGSQYRSVIYERLDSWNTQKWLLIESVDGSYQIESRWDNGYPLAATWMNNKLLIASRFGVDGVKIEVYTILGKDSHSAPVETEFDYNQDPNVVLGLQWTSCTE
jgi:hypothetical protein